MASLIIDGVGSVDYSMDGVVEEFALGEDVIYSVHDGIYVRGWKQKLIKFVVDNDLHINDGKGLHAFVYPLDNYIARYVKESTCQE